MGGSRWILFGSIIAAAVSAAAFAADTTPGSMLIVWPDGSTATVQIDDAQMMNQAKQDATPVTGATIVLIEGGQAYTVPDKKMSNGKMMSENFSTTPRNRRGVQGSPATSGSSSNNTGGDSSNSGSSQ
jgi:hypothetical protein